MARIASHPATLTLGLLGTGLCAQDPPGLALAQRAFGPVTLATGKELRGFKPLLQVEAPVRFDCTGQLVSGDKPRPFRGTGNARPFGQKNIDGTILFTVTPDAHVLGEGDLLFILHRNEAARCYDATVLVEEGPMFRLSGNFNGDKPDELILLGSYPAPARPGAGELALRWRVQAGDVGFNVVLCGTEGPGGRTFRLELRAQPPAQTAPPASGSREEEARALLAQFLAPGADRIALTARLKPTHADYARVFKADSVPWFEEHFATLWRKEEGRVAIAAKEDQTELMLNAATTADLVRWDTGSGQPAAEFPGGWQRIAPHLQPGLTFYRWKFTKPGERQGMAYDGLVWVDGRFVWFPKPWRALPEPTK